MEPRYIEAKKYKDWNFDLKVDFKGIFKAISKGFAAKVLLDAPTAIDAVADAFESVKITVDHGVAYRAYHLIFKAMQRSLLYLVEAPEHMPAIADAMPRERFQTYDAVAFQDMVNEMQALFDSAEEREFKIYETFFKHPEQLSILMDVRALFEEWLQRLGLSQVQAGHIGGRLGTVFVRMLNEVWREKPADYAKIRDEFQDTFPETHLHERDMYNLKLKEEWERPVFDETFGLEQIYVPLRAGYVRIDPKADQEKKVVQVVDAETTIKHWIASTSVPHKIKVLKGGPGSGKSSLMKKLAYELSDLGRQPVYFIELQHLSFESSVDAALKDYFMLVFSEDIFAKSATGPARRPIIIFDGLDELSSSGKTGLEIAKVFVDDLIKLVDRLSEDWQPRILITGRNLLLEPFERNFSEETQVLELLPYRLDMRADCLGYKGADSLLQANQIDDWWKNYLSVKNSALPMPAFLGDNNFKEIVAQPLLNFLMALSYISGEIAFDEHTNPNSAYHHLMTRILKRPWGKHKHLKWTVEEFLEVMEEVATSAWHHSGDVRVTTIEQVKIRCKENDVVRNRIEELENKPEAGYLRLLAAFYFKSGSSQSSDKTFEFTHKSFGEYLVARRLLTLARHIQLGLDNPRFYTLENAKKDWLAVCSQSEITEYIWPFLQRQIALEFQAKKEEAGAIQKTLAGLFSDFINNGFEPGKELTKSLDIIRASRNAEATLILTISSFARVSGLNTKIQWQSRSQPLTVLSRLMLGDAGLVGNGLYKIVFPETVDFWWIYLVGANLSGAQMRYALLNGANLYQTDFSGANLSGANLGGADLQDASLQGADLRGASLRGASLQGAILSGADLQGADLQGADLHGADLYPFFLEFGKKLMDGQEAHNYLVSKGAKNVPKPEGME